LGRIIIKRQIPQKCVKVQIDENDSKKENSARQEVKNRLNSGGVCYHSVQNSFFSRLVSKNFKIKKYKLMTFIICVLHQTLLGSSNKKRITWTGHVALIKRS
jgi:hypothetical protein